MTIKKSKGLVVKKATESKIKFSEDGVSTIGATAEDTHSIVGESTASGSISVLGDLTLDNRLAGHLFSPPHIDGQTEEAQLQELSDNPSSYEGFMFYLKSQSNIEPFVEEQKFYFCENSTWFPSPFTSHIVNNAPYLNPTYEIQAPSAGQEDSPFSLNLPADLFIDIDGDYLTYSATTSGGSELPAWLSFDNTNTILSGTPTADDVGLVVLTITATDPGNLSASTTQEIQILVKPTPFWEGATHEFNTYGEPNWATILPGNKLRLDPINGGSNAWHKITAPDEFDLNNQAVSLDFNFSHWANSGGSMAKNNIRIGFQPTSPANASKFVEFYIYDSGGQSDDLNMWLHTAHGNKGNKTGGNFSYDTYSTPPGDICNMTDLDFRIEIGRAVQHSVTTAFYVPVLLLAKRKNPHLHPELVAAGLDNISFDDLRTSAEFQQLYYDLGNSYPDVYKHFFRCTYSLPISMANETPETGLKVRPYVQAVQRNPGNTNDPNDFLCDFDKFEFTVNQGPILDDQVPFGDFTVEEGQPITITVPSSLFVDPEGDPIVVYGTRQTSYSAIPYWLSFDEITGVYTGTPPVGTAGTYEIAIYGLDDAAESAAQISNPQRSHAGFFQLEVTALLV